MNDINKDIEILESECYYLEELGYLRENNHFIRFNQALENLIKGYRELEEQLKIDKSYGLEKAELQKEAGCKMLKCKIVDKNIRLNLEIINLKKNYISKSKIQEKIDELEKLKKELEKDNNKFWHPEINNIIYHIKELMEDK